MENQEKKSDSENLVLLARALKAYKTEMQLLRQEEIVNDDEAIGRDGKIITFEKDPP
jgi:hypothetical protein